MSRNRLEELVKHDYNDLKAPLTLLLAAFARGFELCGKPVLAFHCVGACFRMGWKGSAALALATAKRYFVETPSVGNRIVEAALCGMGPTERTRPSYERPQNMLDGMITVLRNPRNGRKGVIIINYNVYFLMFLRFFEVETILERFHLILEPSWAGLCEIDILAFTKFKQKILVQAYEPRDFQFLESLASNLQPVDVGPSWFINYRMFNSPAPDTARDIDIVMVAGWAKFKRHAAFFSAIRILVDRRPDLRIALVGYPVDLDRRDIETTAEHAGVLANLEFFEWVQPSEVAAILSRSKCSILWSKFEGNNRAIIESMLCGTPVIMREGHNYGVHYDFINDNTGVFASERNLASKIEGLLHAFPKMDPRKYILEHRSCNDATLRLENAIADIEGSAGVEQHVNKLAIKVNELHGMAYFDRDAQEYESSYEWLAEQVCGVHRP